MICIRREPDWKRQDSNLGPVIGDTGIPRSNLTHCAIATDAQTRFKSTSVCKQDFTLIWHLLKAMRV